jgi:uncharacterized protein YecE (DUF72 family)
VRRQLDLFGSPIARPRDDASLIEFAARLPSHVRLGTSSWTFREWGPLVYVETDVHANDFALRSLAEYATHPLFRTVGIDRSFYAPIRTEELAAYARLLPPDFRAVSKVWSEIATPIFPRHPEAGPRAGSVNPRFLDAELFVEQVAAPYAAAFATHAGPFVIEIGRAPGRVDPDSLARSLATFFERVGSAFDYAVELRDPKLLTPRHLDVLAAHGATHVFNLWTAMPTIGEQLAFAGALRRDTRVVARLMVPRGHRYSALERAWAPFDRIRRIDETMRADAVALARRCEELGCELHLIVNNKAEGCAPLTVRALAERLVATR